MYDIMHRRCFAAPGSPGDVAMGMQMDIALCAIFSVVIGIVGINQRRK